MDNGPCRGPEGPFKAIATVKTMLARPACLMWWAGPGCISSSLMRTAMDMVDKMDAVWMDSLDGLYGGGAVLISVGQLDKK